MLVSVQVLLLCSFIFHLPHTRGGGGLQQGTIETEILKCISDYKKHLTTVQRVCLCKFVLTGKNEGSLYGECCHTGFQGEFGIRFLRINWSLSIVFSRGARLFLSNR
jgi:hypothetical protein